MAYNNKMNELSLNQGIDHRELCKSRLKEKAINCYKDEGLQNQIYEKVLETLGHFGKFITRID